MAKQLAAAVAAFHRRPLRDIYRVLVLDGVVLKRKTGAGALAWPVLVAPGLRPDGKKEVPSGQRRERRAVGAVPRRPGTPRPDPRV